jgi:hypothetical protein
MMRRLAFGLVSLVVVLACVACGSPSTRASCAALAPAYTDLVAQLIAREGNRDPAAYGPEIADLAQWWPKVRIIGWLSDALTTDEIHTLEAEIGAWEEVSAVVYFAKADALQEFREMFADQPELIAAVEDDPSVLPASLRVDVLEASNDEVIQRLAAIPGVTQVSSAHEDLQALRTQAVEAAIHSSGLEERAAEIAAKASELHCSWGLVAQTADLDRLDPGGVVGEWIIAVAREGLPVAEDGE